MSFVKKGLHRQAPDMRSYVGQTLLMVLVLEYNHILLDRACIQLLISLL